MAVNFEGFHSADRRSLPFCWFIFPDGRNHAIIWKLKDEVGMVVPKNTQTRFVGITYRIHYFNTIISLLIMISTPTIKVQRGMCAVCAAECGGARHWPLALSHDLTMATHYEHAHYVTKWRIRDTQAYLIISMDGLGLDR